MKPLDDLTASTMAFAALTRLARQGLLTAPANPTDEISCASQALLLEAGVLVAEPFGLSADVRAELPHGVDGELLAGLLQETLAFMNRFAAGASPGWAERDPDLIRNRGRTSAASVIDNIFSSVFDRFPAVAERVGAAEGRFLDVGVGCAGIALEMCRRYPSLSVVGLDTSPVMLAVARADIESAGFGDRIEVREQSVADVTDICAFDLMWLPQPFIPRAALTAGLSRLAKAGRPGSLLVLRIYTNDRTGINRSAEEVQALMTGGGTLSFDAATALLRHSGFTSVATMPIKGSPVLVASVG